MTRSRKAAGDADLFAAVMRDVKPLRRPRPAAPAAPRHATAAPSRVDIRPVPADTRSVPGNPGIDRRTAERLRKGDMTIDRRLDLHGMT
ncbi:MAG: hypothetical protein JO128_17430, partial [Alphaproteobacteria bacterium]|nr:hypothetical protein [Alphaproteobacteria bacterium]